MIPECGHEVKAMCSVQPDHLVCNEKCKRTLVCGHKCTGVCGNRSCMDAVCQELVIHSYVTAACGHADVTAPCWIATRSRYSHSLTPSLSLPPLTHSTPLPPSPTHSLKIDREVCTHSFIHSK